MAPLLAAGRAVARRIGPPSSAVALAMDRSVLERNKNNVVAF